jgi:hypothetical protein
MIPRVKGMIYTRHAGHRDHVGLGRSNTGIVGSNATRGVSTCVCVALSCVGSGLARADTPYEESCQMSKRIYSFRSEFGIGAGQKA